MKTNNFKNHFTFIAGLFFLVIANSFCGTTNNKQTNNEHVIKNKSLPKDLKINANLIKIIDSVFNIKNGKSSLQFQKITEFKNGILVSAKSSYYQNDSINQSIDEVYDANGNVIENNTFLHFNNTHTNFIKKLDEYGNIVHLTHIEGNKIVELDYQNTYENNKLQSIVVLSSINGDTIHNERFKHDSKGNIIEQQLKTSYSESKSLYFFNKSNQDSLHKQYRKGHLSDSIVYFYANNLLIRKEWYEWYEGSYRPMFEVYQYNLKNQLIAETFNDNTTTYKNYDEVGNWQSKEQYESGNLSSVSKRKFIYE